MQTNRSAWLDIAKGSAILLVVINHSAEGILAAGIGEEISLWKLFHNICYTFHVPVFFFISGWLSQLSNKSPKARASALLSNTVYPYLLWSVLQAVVMIVTASGNIVPTWNKLPLMLLNGAFQFWFLHCLILITAIDVILRSTRVIISVRLCGAICIASTAMLGVHFPWKLDAVAQYIIYYEVGVAVASVNSLRLPVNIPGLAFGGGVLLVALYLAGAGYPTDLRPLGAFAGISMCLAVSSLIARSKSLLPAALELCGRCSLQIFASHLIFAAGLRVVLARAGVTAFWIHFASGSLAGIALPLLLAYLDKRFLKVLFRWPDFSKVALPSFMLPMQKTGPESYRVSTGGLYGARENGLRSESPFSQP